jgi:hypothetical protein
MIIKNNNRFDPNSLNYQHSKLKETFGIPIHFRERTEQRFNVPLETLLDNVWSHTPSIEGLPTSLSNQCLETLNRKDSDGIEKRFLINDEHNCIFVLKSNRFSWTTWGRERPKPEWWCDWNIVTVYPCIGGVWLEKEETPKERVKVGNKYYYI